MTASFADIRLFLIEFFNDEDLNSLCFDHFREVYNNFTADMPISRKARELIDYCIRRDRLPELLVIIQRERPEPYRRIFGRQTAAADRRINLNTANIEELRNLPGIGPRLAAAIAAARPYTTVDDLARVPGIGVKRLAAVRDWCVA